MKTLENNPSITFIIQLQRGFQLEAHHFFHIDSTNLIAASVIDSIQFSTRMGSDFAEESSSFGRRIQEWV
jgi:hypothetical protein